MRRFLLLLSLFLVATTVSAGSGRNRDVSMSIEDGDEVTDCGDLTVRFNGQRATMVSQEIPFTGRALKVKSETHGGIRATGWNGSSYGITLCKAAAPGSSPDQIRVSVQGNELTATGPENDQWVAYFLIRVPRNGDLELSSENGPISLDNVNGRINAQAENGPVSVKDSSGTIVATTTNGPVSISGGSGQVRLAATNGPVSVKLAGSTWDGKLDASTKNGPVSLKIPRGFRSGVLVTSAGHGPVTCRAEGCPRGGFRYDDESNDRPREIELGSGDRVVRLSTVNGPISVKDMD